MLGTTSLPSIHNNMGVEKGGKQVAAFRIIPLVCENETMDKLKAILSKPLFSVKPYRAKTASLLITGTEVYEGKIKDGFKPVIEAKLKKYGLELVDYRIVPPDEMNIVVNSVRELASKSDLVITTGGTSVDPDDITAQAMANAGVVYEMKGTPIQPGNNMTVGYLNDVPVCAVPAAALHFTATSLDILFPRMLAGEKDHKRGLGKTCTRRFMPFLQKMRISDMSFRKGG